MRCPSCGSSALHDLNFRTKDGKRVDVYKCFDCKKYISKKGRDLVVQPDAPRPKEPERIAFQKDIEPSKEDSILGCEICGKPIEDGRKKRGSLTCGKVCSAVHNQRKKDEYHRLRKMRIAEKKGFISGKGKELLPIEVPPERVS